MSIADELSKLEDLRRRGVLNDAEFEQAKAAVLAGTAPVGDGPVVEHLAAQLAEARYQNELTRLDREWEIEREQYMISSKYGKQVPTPGVSIAGAVIIGIFGVIWTFFSLNIMSGFGEHGRGPGAMASCVFPLVGVLFTAFGVWMGIHTYGKARKYQEALAAYQRRRAAVRPEQFASQPDNPPRQPPDERFTT